MNRSALSAKQKTFRQGHGEDKLAARLPDLGGEDILGYKEKLTELCPKCRG